MGYWARKSDFVRVDGENEPTSIVESTNSTPLVLDAYSRMAISRVCLGLVPLAVYFVGQYSVGIFAFASYIFQSSCVKVVVTTPFLQEMRSQTFLDTQKNTAATCPRAACGRVESDDAVGYFGNDATSMVEPVRFHSYVDMYPCSSQPQIPS